ncbi:hypothetical protein GF342_02625 [Candidatus Woesearchaeota archaeon]|nr:hypothetical protein [Candidatus Woesearchaeota archaeon]
MSKDIAGRGEQKYEEPLARILQDVPVEHDARQDALYLQRQFSKASKRAQSALDGYRLVRLDKKGPAREYYRLTRERLKSDWGRAAFDEFCRRAASIEQDCSLRESMRKVSTVLYGSDTVPLRYCLAARAALKSRSPKKFSDNRCMRWYVELAESLDPRTRRIFNTVLDVIVESAVTYLQTHGQLGKPLTGEVLKTILDPDQAGPRIRYAFEGLQRLASILKEHGRLSQEHIATLEETSRKIHEGYNERVVAVLTESIEQTKQRAVRLASIEEAVAHLESEEKGGLIADLLARIDEQSVHIERLHALVRYHAGRARDAEKESRTYNDFEMLRDEMMQEMRVASQQAARAQEHIVAYLRTQQVRQERNDEAVSILHDEMDALRASLDRQQSDSAKKRTADQRGDSSDACDAPSVKAPDDVRALSRRLDVVEQRLQDIQPAISPDTALVVALLQDIRSRLGGPMMSEKQRVVQYPANAGSEEVPPWQAQLDERLQQMAQHVEAAEQLRDSFGTLIKGLQEPIEDPLGDVINKLLGRGEE